MTHLSTECESIASRIGSTEHDSSAAIRIYGCAYLGLAHSQPSRDLVGSQRPARHQESGDLLNREFRVHPANVAPGCLRRGPR